MEQLCQTGTKQDNIHLTAILTENGETLRPKFKLIRQAHMAVKEFIGVLGRAALEAVLQLSAQDETFAINRLGLPPKLRPCPATANIIESRTAGVRLGTRGVTNWRNGETVL